MTTRKRAVQTVEIDGELLNMPDDNDPIEEAEEKEELQLRNAMAQFMGESGAKLYIYDMNSKSANGAGVFVEKLTLTDHDHDEILERLRDVHYGGDFKLQIRNKNGHIQMNQLVSVVKKEKPTPEEQQKNDIAGIINAVKDNNQNNNTEIFQMMMQNSQQQMQTMMQQSNQQMTMIIESLKTLKPEPAPQLTTKDMLAMLVSMKELNANEGTATDPMDTFIKGITMGKELGEGGNDSTLSTAIKALAPSFNGITEQLKNATQPATSPTPAAFPPTDTLPEPEKVKLLEAQKLLQKLQPLLVQCNDAAKQNGNIELYASLLIDQLGVEVIKQYIGENSYYEKLFQWMPELRPQRAWFDHLRQTVLTWVASPAPTEPDHVPEPDTPSPLSSLAIPGPPTSYVVPRGTDAPDLSGEPAADGSGDAD
jgi:hypothetical protein